MNNREIIDVKFMAWVDKTAHDLDIHPDELEEYIRELLNRCLSGYH